MATTVDERIVAAKFDASDFEKGVDKTVKKLDELKKSLDLTDATKSVKELADKTEASTKSMGKSLDTLTNRLTTFTGMIKQRILGGLADEVAGVFFKMENSVKSFVKSISTDQISNGMSKYQSMLTSVRQMVNAGYEEDRVFEILERTQEYTDETSYSFEQMTDAMSKMVAAGVDLEVAAKAVEGIANASANAGINAQDASRAFYNLAQAYSKGKLEYTDYRSLELLNMTTKGFKEQALEAGVAAGTLEKKVDKAGNAIYKTTKKAKQAGKIVNEKNLTDMLRYDWFNTEAMNQLFGKTYWMEIIDKDELAKLRKELGDVEFEKRFGKIATQAYQAAYEARSFLDVINAIKDAVSSGWSKTFNYLFGGLEQAKNFFTDLANGELADVVYTIGEYRNTILSFWSGRDAEGDLAGGALFEQVILNITDALGTLFKTFLKVLPGFTEVGEESQDTLKAIGHRLFEFSMHARDFSVRVKEAAKNFDVFMNSSITADGKGPSRIELIRQVFANLGATLGIVGNALKLVFDNFTKVFGTLQPVFDGILVFLTKVTQPLVDLKDNIKVIEDIQHAINNLVTILSPIVDVLGTIVGFLGDIGAFFAQMAIDTVTMNIEFFSDALGLLLELLTGGKSSQAEKGVGVLASFRKEFEGIKQACDDGIGAVKGFFSALLGDVRKLLGLADETQGEANEGGFFDGLKNFFATNQFISDTKKWIDEMITKVGDFIKNIPSRIKNFAVNIYSTIYNLLFTEETDESGKPTGETILTPLGEWLDGVIKDVKKFVLSIPDRIIAGVGKVADFVNTIFDYLFGTEHVELVAEADTSVKGQAQIKKETTDKVTSRFDQFVSDVTNGIKEWFYDLPNKIETALGSIGNFFSRLLSVVSDFLFGTEHVEAVMTPGTSPKNKRNASTITTKYKAGFAKWLDGFIKEMKNFIRKIPEYIKAGIKGAGDIITAITSAIFGKKDGKEVTSKDVQEKIEEPLKRLNLTFVLNSIKEIGQTLLNQIARIFTGSEDIEVNQQWFAEKIAAGIGWIRERVAEAVPAVLNFLKSLPTRIAELFSADTPTEGRGPVWLAIHGFALDVKGFIESIPVIVTDAFTTAVSKFDELWTNLYNSIIGQTEKLPEEAATAETQEKSKWDEFVEKLGNLISSAFEKLPDWVAKGIHMAVIGVQRLMSNATKLLTGNNVTGGMNKVIKDMSKPMAVLDLEGEDLFVKKNQDAGSALLDAIKGIGQTLYDLITTTIPGFIQSAWTFILGSSGTIWNTITTMFDNFKDTDFANTISNLGNSITTAILALPDKIKIAFEKVSAIVKNLFNQKESAPSRLGRQIEDAMVIDQAPNKDQMRKKGEEVGEQTGTPFIEAIKTSLLGVFESVGPVILNGLSKALNWIGDIATFVVNALTGKASIADQIEAAYGKEQPELRTALQNIGESIKTFFMNTIPSLLGAAFGELATNAETWFKTFFDALGKAKDKELNNFENKNGDNANGGSQIENAKSTVTTFMDTLNSVFDSLKWIQGTNVVAAIGLIVALGVLFNALADMFSLVGELEAAEGIVKWGAIAIAISAIAGLFHYITQIVDSGEEDKLNRFEGILDKLGELMKTIAWIVGLFSAGKLVDMIGSFGGKSGDKLTGADKVVSGLMSGISGFMESIGMGLGAKIGLDLAASGADDFLNTVSDSLVDITSGVDDVVKMTTPFIDELLSLKDKIDDAIDITKKLPELFMTLYSSFSDIYKGAGITVSTDDHGLADVFDKNGTWVGTSTDSLSGGLTEFMKEVDDELQLFMSLSAFLNNVTNSLSHLENVSNIGERLTELHDAFTSSNGEISFATILKDLFNAMHEALMHSDMDPTLFEDFKGMSVGLDILASAMSIFANAISGFDTADMDAFSKMMEAFQQLAVALTDITVEKGALGKVFTGDNSLSKFGGELKKFGMHMEQFFGYISNISGFSTEDIESTTAKIASVIQLAEKFAEVSTTMVGGNGFVEVIGDLGEKLPAFGTGIAGLFDRLHLLMPTISQERATVLMDAVNTMSGMFRTMGDLTNLIQYNPGHSLSDILNTLFGDVSNVDNKKSFAEIVKTFSTSIDEILGNEEFLESYKNRGATIAQKLFEGIQTAFTEDPSLQPQITPVLNMESVKQQLSDFFGTSDLSSVDLSSMARAAAGANSQTDQAAIDAATLYESIGSVKESVDALALRQVSIGDVTRAFAGMKIVTNTGALVGALTDDIDAAIGRKIWLITRNTTP